MRTSPINQGCAYNLILAHGSGDCGGPDRNRQRGVGGEGVPDQSLPNVVFPHVLGKQIVRVHNCIPALIDSTPCVLIIVFGP